MKRKTILTALIFMLLSAVMLPSFSVAKTSVPDHTESFYVNDFAGVIDQKTENYMVNYGVKLHQASGAQVVLATVDSTKGVSMKEYANALFNTWGVGSADKNNGVLLLLSVKDDDYWVVQGKGLVNTLSDGQLSQILSQYLEPDFARKDYNSGARKTYGELIQRLGGVWTEQTANSKYVADNAGVFKQVTKDYLNQSSYRYKSTSGSGIYVVTVKNTGVKNLQEYVYSKFASTGAGPRDVVLVLDIGGDNYHVLQGRDIDKTLTNELISSMLDKELEPYFAKKEYAAGATAMANALYGFFLARADHYQQPAASASQPAAAAAGAAAGSVENTVTITEREPVSTGNAILIFALVIGGILLISLAVARRNRYIVQYGVPVNPYHQRNIRRYGTWNGQAGYGYGSRWYNRRHRRPSRPSSAHSSSFWSSSNEASATNEGGGGSSSGGGAGRYSRERETNSGGGGSSSGGGSGRYSYDSDDSDDSGYSSGSSGDSGGGGSASSGGGVGRHG
ncbi:hypothetical protein C2I18_25750 [Paenibacillus sp. PK3_47]|uniref:TPM domain-containing protein n=1 Tax=Paenibacillus sp. PK3_47 TaxID=2072642 RepID=UPI00201DF8A1|nr:TPM domain-containing protein [Paenibacillus sp. PK3_47]UQZ36639.1 hypothetical protein C2I18_25750 [Paenibacillus sp. PK3_47]